MSNVSGLDDEDVLEFIVICGITQLVSQKFLLRVGQYTRIDIPYGNLLWQFAVRVFGWNISGILDYIRTM